jgi:16S rRNA (guanine966-N2)-methyltransferase
MRVIAGRFRSRKLKPVPGIVVRPTPDRLREALFNVLAPHIEGSVFLDAYAGTGTVGIEALSRGARHAFFVEFRRAAVEIIHENLSALGIEPEATVIHGSATEYLPRFTGDIVFLDPPYDRPEEYQASLTAAAETECKLVIAQHASRQPLADAYGRLTRTRILRQGDNSLSFYQPAER